MNSFGKIWKGRMLFIGMSIFALAMVSCSDDDESTGETDGAITEEEAAEAISMSVSPESGGMVEQTSQAIYTIEGTAPESSKVEDYSCGEEYGSSYSISGQSGNITYSANLTWDWIIDCDSDLNPTTADFELTGTVNYDGPRISSDGSTNASMNIINLEKDAPSYLVNESYTVSGSQESFVRNENSFTSSIELSTTDLNILKSNHNVTSGTIYASFVGETSNGNTYNYNGTLVFTGNQTATLTMGSGNTYELAW
ncbi:hypothetical protein PY092_13415 [Muricauda sp. 334s03]|uniref:Lipoprotein n=1 Tax=Flagellimonas yonaguniensis TaxID=3031325 RepID=A0ABT5Y1F4_9FLAO|nr:hypothetical protein [[Muricauda] yonaguniensis]MDF0717156.1 hypothetical protein [[Muricauda] yonaguniensis]